MSQVRNVGVGGEKVQEFVMERLLPALDDEELNVAVVGMVMMCGILQKPSMQQDQKELGEFVKNVTQYMSLNLLPPVTGTVH